METKKDVLRDALTQYLKGTKEEKGGILTRLCETVHMHRKAVIRHLRTLQTRKEGVNWNDHRGRPRYYGKDVTAALHALWECAHRICAERLHAVKEEYLIPLIRDRMWHHSDEATGKLRSMSLGTMKNRIAQFDRVVQGGGRNLTKPSSLKEVIPVRRGPWEHPLPGYGEIDTVAHCGNTVEGLFAYTAQYTDVATTWCFLGAQMGKGKMETLATISAWRERSPFLLRGLDPDSGSEFINWNLKDWCDHHHIELTRIRPGMKNDHGRIEQKNNTNVRQFAGYIRIDTEERLSILTELLAVLEVYVNHFLPSMKCTEKVRENRAHSSRKYDIPQTPYQRVMAHADIPHTVKETLRTYHTTLNPKTLHDEILRLQKRLFHGATFTRSDV
jgi:hypothetical protein